MRTSLDDLAHSWHAVSDDHGLVRARLALIGARLEVGLADTERRPVLVGRDLVEDVAVIEQFGVLCPRRALKRAHSHRDGNLPTGLEERR